MPFTPYHFGPAFLLGVVVFPVLDIAALMISSVVLDLEPLVVLMFGLPSPLHGNLHTFLGAAIVAALTACVIWVIRTPLQQLLSLFALSHDPTFSTVLISSVIGTYSHVLLDSFLYAEMNPFFPLLGNPLLGLIEAATIYQFCVYCMMFGLVIYALRLVFRYKQNH
ncbi:MAG: hypothetical protein ACFFAY_08875 [Promethearchaeota archaeon]